MGNREPLLMVCRSCGGTVEVRVTRDDYRDWRDGYKCVQDSFPYLTPAERELFLTHLCPACADKLFAGLKEPDEYEV